MLLVLMLLSVSHCSNRGAPSAGCGAAAVRAVEGLGGDPLLDGLRLTAWEAFCGLASRLCHRSVAGIWGLCCDLVGVELLEFDGRQVVEVAVQALGVVPVHPAERGELDLLDGLPRAGAGRSADQLGLVVAVDGLGQRVVIAVADRSDRRDRADLREPLAVANGRELRSGV